VRPPQRLEQPLRYGTVGTAPSRNDDGARALDERQPTVRRNADAAQGTQRPRLDGSNPEAIPGIAHLGAIEAEYLGGHAELEGAQTVIGERHHEAVLERLWSPSAFWHDLYAPWHLRHLSRTPSVPSNLL
jgi:hypothetical protein